EVKGLAARKIEQLRALGVVANESNWLQSHLLLAKPIEQALLTLQKLPGIGPFSAELVLLRGAGHTDVFPKNEFRLQKAMAISYELGADPEFDKLELIAEKWRPFRSWAGLLLRNSIPR
ncbi:MAG: DNA-3-methyladenine glycosylase 2 family protein, partial [Bdellovibrionaceae bacterium]|nr:DNA-3-methyladenine glycosylase 2 family protein [Pseudobdellovibrionaceae bacterium]